jgi:hypothetical protein
MLLPLNNIRVLLHQRDGDDYISGEVSVRLTTKIPRGLCDDPEALDDFLWSLIGHVKKLTSQAYTTHERVIGDRPYEGSIP